MENTKLLTILRELEKDEWFSLKKFISQHTSENSDLFLIFNLFYANKKVLSKFDDTKEITSKHFPKMAPKIFLNHMSTLFQWTQDWLVFQEVKKDDYEYETILYQALSKRGHYTLANQKKEILFKEIRKNEAIDIDGIKALHKILEIQHYDNNPVIYEDNGYEFENMVNLHLELMQAKNFLYKAEMINFGRIKSYDYKTSIAKIDKINEFLEENKCSQILKILIDFVETPNYEVFEKINKYLLENKIMEGSELQKLVIYYLHKGLAKLHQTGNLNKSQKSENFQLCNLAIEIGVFYSNGKIIPVTFRNLIIIICNLEEYSKCNEFIEKWINKVNSTNVESTKNICKALNCFYHERYDEILNYTWMKSYDDVTEKTLGTFLQLVYFFYFRDKEKDMFLTILKNFHQMIERNKKSYTPNLYQGYSNLYDFIKTFDKTLDRQEKLKSYSTIQFRIWCERMIERESKSLQII